MSAGVRPPGGSTPSQPGPSPSKRPGGPASSFALLVRTLLLEASFNPRGLQRAGRNWALEPLEVPPETEPFQANPSLAGYALGWIAEEGAPALAPRRGTLLSTLGAIGDRLVWGLLRPASVLLALVAALALLSPDPSSAVPAARWAGAIAAATLLLVYNAPELYLRWRSLQAGRRGSASILADLSQEGLLRWPPRLARLFALSLGMLGGVAGAAIWIDSPKSSWGRAIAGIAWVVLVLALGSRFRRRGLGTWGLPIAALLLGLLGWLLASFHLLHLPGGISR
ncbi:MAG: hypothetical protein ACE15D_12465 [Candidatus Eisenbacteria bacterium]